jgi:Arp2/3 complex, 34 kD subunit p34-Arc
LQGQIFLDAFNPILQECIGSRLKEGVRKPCELRVSDFDDVTYRIVVTREAPGTLRLSVSLAAWSYIKGNGGAEMLTAVYPGMAAATPDSGYHITLVVDLDNPTVQPDELLQRYDTNNVYCLKLHCHTLSGLARLRNMAITVCIAFEVGLSSFSTRSCSSCPVNASNASFESLHRLCIQHTIPTTTLLCACAVWQS